jgi:hypothetical protein
MNLPDVCFDRFGTGRRQALAGASKCRRAEGFRDVLCYRWDELRLQAGGVSIPVTYQKTWDDGYGARGWKPDIAIGNPAIIASTRQTGDRLPTSVLVHDLLDHIISGFDMGGHRAEAMASHQLYLRTGSDVRKDNLQLVLEDLRFGRVNGESMISFLPPDLVATIPSQLHHENEQVAAFLRKSLGDEVVIDLLNDRMSELGRQGEQHACNSWAALGLNKDRAGPMGLQLQALLDQIDKQVEQSGVERLRAVFRVSDRKSSIEVLRGSVEPDCNEMVRANG